MPLGNDYTGQSCSLARALEIIGERWTLLIVRDAFFGVRRFADFVAHLDIPRAVLASRLKALVEAGVLERVPGPGARDEYALTEKGAGLWPVVRDLMAWGDEHYSPDGPRRIMRHAADDGLLDENGRCQKCGQAVPVSDTLAYPGPGLEPREPIDEPVNVAFRQTRRLLEPMRPSARAAG